MDVSVVIPTRNRSRLLAMTLRSALRQQGVDFEVVVVDEASTDDTPAVLAAVGDARVRVVRHDAARGLSAARNHGAAEARGDWLAFLDDDDLWAPDKLFLQLDACQRTGRDWVYTGAVNIEGKRIVRSTPPLPPEHVVAGLRRYNPIPGGGSNVCVRRTTWLKTGPFETRFRSGGEDWDMSIRLARHGLPAWVCRPLVAKRVHSSNMSLDVAEIVRATRLIETLHDTTADWGSIHRWLADRHLRNGHRRAALGAFAKAAFQGQARGVITDVAAILRRRLARQIGTPPAASTDAEDAWAAAAAAWLEEFEGGIAGSREHGSVRAGS